MSFYSMNLTIQKQCYMIKENHSGVARHLGAHGQETVRVPQTNIVYYLSRTLPWVGAYRTRKFFAQKTPSL